MALSSFVFGQSVPNTTTFSLQDVENAISGTQGNLNQCFTDAIQSHFNTTFKNQYYTQYGNLNNLLMFRDYGPHNAITIPIVLTNDASGVTASYANLNGNVTSDGGASLTARGFEISVNSNMSSSTFVPNIGQTGAYQSGYNANCTQTTYYYRAYAINSAGTGYGSVVNFTTLSPAFLAYTFYYQIDGITINSQATATEGANALYFNQLGVNGSNTRFATTIGGTGQLIYTSDNPGCRLTGEPPLTYWVTVHRSSSIWVINYDHQGVVLQSTPYTPTTTTYTTSSTWTTPANIRYAQIECWGGGGTGGPATGGGARAAGGAGGTYAKKTLTVTPTSSYVYTVGGASTASTTAKVDGNPTFWGSASFATATCAANGGVGGGVNATIGGAAATTAATTGSVGDVIYAGGNGGAGTPAESSGGGGGGAGSGGAGGNATNSTAGTGTANNGGNGGAGVSASNAKNNGSNYGGGGSGGLTATSTDRSGGNGAAGYLRITY